jgi:hypothetical protein
MTKKKIVYRVTSPLNFAPDENIQHGTFEDFDELPDWAKNNVHVVVEKVEIEEQLILEKQDKKVNPEKNNETEIMSKEKINDENKGRKSTNEEIKKNESKSKIPKRNYKKRKAKKAGRDS